MFLCNYSENFVWAVCLIKCENYAIIPHSMLIDIIIISICPYILGLGWSLCYSDTWRALEVEIPRNEFSGFSIWGCFFTFLSPIVANFNWLVVLFVYSILLLSASNILSVYLVLFANRWLMIVHYFIYLNEGRRNWWKGIGLFSLVSSSFTVFLFL